MSHARASLAALGGAFVLSACQAQLDSAPASGGQSPLPMGSAGAASGTGGMPPSATDPCVGAAPDPGRSPLRRLSRVEYISTVSDLLGLPNAEALASAFPPDERAAGFSNNADALVVSSLLAGNYSDVAEKLAAAALAKPTPPVVCSANEAETACVSRFIEAFGKRAFRRPLDAEERSRYLGLFSQARTDGTWEDGVSTLLRGFLQSPHFLYRVESPQAVPAPNKVVPATPYELATRLSYALWGTMPDDALFAAAEQGKLATVAGVEEQVRAMLVDERAKRTIAGFHGEWLDIGGVTSVSKDPTVFGASDWNSALQNDLRTELSTFVNEVFWHDGRLETLLSASYSYLNASLAGFYGVPAPAGAGFVRTELDVKQRAGVLTSGALMAFLASNNQTSPVHRGQFVREKILCQELPAPPANLVIKVPVVTPNSSTRERYAQHSQDPACAGCHQLMDPIGLGFENYDPIGRWRTKDGPSEVNATGEVVQTLDANGPFNGAVELARRLAVSNEARACVATQVFRFAVGRSETEADRCTLSGIQKKLAQSNYDLRELWVSVASSDAFRYRSVDGGGL